MPAITKHAFIRYRTGSEFNPAEREALCCVATVLEDEFPEDSFQELLLSPLRTDIDDLDRNEDLGEFYELVRFAYGASNAARDGMNVFLHGVSFPIRPLALIGLVLRFERRFGPIHQIELTAENVGGPN